MKTKPLIINLLASCLLAATAQATTYYVSQDDGDDSHDGLAPSWDGVHGPWKWLENVGLNVFSAGSTILLKRGNVWSDGNAFIVNGVGTSASPNTIGAYGSGPNPVIQGTSDKSDGTVGLYIATPDYWIVDGIDFKKESRSMEVLMSNAGHVNFTVKNCNFSGSDYAEFQQGWSVPQSATGICMSGYNLPPGATALSGVTIDNCKFSTMGTSVSINNYGQNGNLAKITNVLISNCVMEDGSFVQLVANGATDVTVQNTKIWNNGMTIDAGPANFAFYAFDQSFYLPTKLVVQDCEIAFARRDNSPRDGDGIELQNISGQAPSPAPTPAPGSGATFRRVLFHHNEAVAAVVNSTASSRDVLFDNCVFAADESNDVNAACERYGEIRLHSNLAANFTACRFLPRSSLQLANGSGYVTWNNPPDIPELSGSSNGSCVAGWHNDITYSNTTTSEYGKEVLGSDFAAGLTPSFYTETGYPTYQYSFAAARTVNTVVLTETAGAGVTKFVVQYWDSASAKWRDAYTGKTLGTSTPQYDTYLPFPPRSTTSLRVQRIDGGTAPFLAALKAYNTVSTNPTDQFLSTTLDTAKWSWVRPYPYWNLYQHLGFLRIATDGHVLWGTGTTPPNSIVLRAVPAGDWTAKTRLTFAPTANYQQAGIILYSNDDNYLKISYGHDSAQPGGNAVDFILETGGAPNPFPKVAVTSAPISVRIVKTGNTYVGSWSVDDVTWNTVGQYTVSLASPRIGLIAQSTVGAYPDFDWFDVR